MSSEASIYRHFESLSLDAEAREYLSYNAQRYVDLITVAESLRAQLPSPAIRIMDIGPSFFTDLLRDRFPDDEVHTLGLAHAAARGGHLPEGLRLDRGTFHEFNLNDAQRQERWTEIPPCELVFMAEVMEHLYTAPTLVLRFVCSFLSPGGYLVVTVPNATALTKRWAMLRGTNPSEMLRENADNPGHYREYTGAEMRQIAEQCGLRVCTISMLNYNHPFSADTYTGRVKRFLTTVAPATMHNNIRAVLQKPRLDP